MTFGNTSGRVVPYYAGGTVANPCNVLQRTTNPPANPTGEAIGTLWVNTVSGATFILVSNTSITAIWSAVGAVVGAVNTVNGLVPVGGNITIAGTANQLTATNAGNTVTLSVPVTFIAPGSIQATTTLSAASLTTTGSVASGTTMSAGTAFTAGTTITATAGNITATNGNFVASAASSGMVWPVVTVTGASPQVNNSRAGTVTFTGVSIAASATQTFVMTNSTVTAGSRIMFNMIGATTGAALSFQSYTPGAGTVSIVVENGAGAVTSVANIAFDFIIMN